MTLNFAEIEIGQLTEAQRKLGITAGGVPATRRVDTAPPLVGGGDLSADLMLGIPQATAAVSGYLSAPDFVIFSAKESVLTFGLPLVRTVNAVAMPAATGAVDGYLTAANFVIFNAKVATTRAINTTAPLTGGGTLAGDLTLAISAASASAAGSQSAADFVAARNVVGMLRGGIYLS